MKPNNFCAARRASIIAPGSLSDEEARGKYTLSLIELASAAARLRSELQVFTRRWPFSQEELAKDFLTSIRHHRFLLEEAYAVFGTVVAPFSHLDAYERIFKGKVPSLAALLQVAERSVVDLSWEWTRTLRDIDLAEKEYIFINEGDRVPTASPREILVSLVVNDKKFMGGLPSSEPEKFLAKIGRHIDLPLEPIDLFPENEFTLTTAVADGTVKMLFVCFHGNPSSIGKRARFHVGGNEENWGTLVEIAEIRRHDRDYRLKDYVPFAQGAFNALKGLEDVVRSECPNANTEDRDTVAAMRLKAIEGMRLHRAFLGRTLEDGQAFTSSGQAAQCCYLCRGMMGYRVHMKIKNRDVKAYLHRFDWAARQGYAHSCAEIAVSFQCAIEWTNTGHDANH